MSPCHSKRVPAAVPDASASQTFPCPNTHPQKTAATTSPALVGLLARLLWSKHSWMSHAPPIVPLRSAAVPVRQIELVGCLCFTPAAVLASEVWLVPSFLVFLACAWYCRHHHTRLVVYTIIRILSQCAETTQNATKIGVKNLRATFHRQIQATPVTQCPDSVFNSFPSGWSSTPNNFFTRLLAERLCSV